MSKFWTIPLVLGVVMLALWAGWAHRQSIRDDYRESLGRTRFDN